MISKATEAELDASERDWEDGVRERQAKAEVQWRERGHTWSWIDLRPKYLQHTWWYGWEDENTGTVNPPGFLREPTEACRVIFRLDMIGGGQVKVIDHWTPTNDPTFPPYWHSRTDLRITAHHRHVLGNYSGHLWTWYSEMCAAAVVLNHADTQDVADRVAATFRALSTETGSTTTPAEPDRFYALLAGGAHCAVCNRPLVDEISKLVCVGPDCAKRWRIPHSRAAASKRLELRHQLLGRGY